MIQFYDHSLGEIAPDHRIGPCVWRHFDLLAVHRGRVVLNVLGDDEIELHAKQAILIYPHTQFTAHSAGTTARASAQHFAITANSTSKASPSPRRSSHEALLPASFNHLAGKTKGYRIFSRSVSDEADADIQRAISFAHRPHTSLNHSARVSLLSLILCQLLQEDIRVSGEGSDTAESIDFSRLIDRIKSGPEKQISIADMARSMKMSTSHFRSLFTTVMGVSPGRYVAHVRYAEARRLLRETRLPIKEVGLRVGYHETAHFYRFFSARSDLTPKAYRSRYQLNG